MISLNLEKILSNLKKIKYPFLDQIVFSGFNFLLGLLIIRLFNLKIFGEFSYFWLIYLFIYTIQNSIILTPLISKYYFIPQIKKKNYVSSIFLIQTFFCLILFLILNFFYYQNYFFIEIILYDKYIQSFTLTVCASQFYHFSRKLLYCEKKYKKIFFIDLIIYSLCICVLIFINYKFNIDLNNIFEILSLTYFLGFLFNFRFLLKIEYLPKNFKKIFKQNYDIGKWLTINAVVQWLSNNLWMVNTGIILGATSLGVLRACQSIIQVLNVIYQILENILPEKITNKIKSNKSEIFIFVINFIKINIKYILLLTLLIILFSKIILNVLFGEEIMNYYSALIILSLSLPFIFLRYPINIAFKSLSETKYIFFSNLVPTIVTLILSRYIIENFGFHASLFGILLNQILISSIMFGFFMNFLKIRI